MFPSRFDLTRSLNMSLVILYINPVINFCFLFYTIVCFSIHQFPAQYFLYSCISLFIFFFLVHTRSKMLISTLQFMVPKLNAKETVVTDVLIHSLQGITSTLI